MKAAVVGSSGYIAGSLLKRLKETEEVDTLLRIGRKQDADFVLELTQADGFDYSVLQDIPYVIFTAAVSGPDLCAREYEACRKVNVDGTCYFIQKALDMGCRVLFFSSDAVYGDLPGHVYTEQSDTCADTPYGRMKKEVEDRFKDCALFKAVRFSYVVSARDKFVAYCMACMEKQETAEVYHPFYRNCITLGEANDLVVWLMKNWDGFPHRFLNACGTELVSRVRIADEINRMEGQKLNYTITMPDAAFYRNRPVCTQMKSLYLHPYHILERKSFTEMFQREWKDKTEWKEGEGIA